MTTKKMKFEVSVNYSGICNFIVEADSSEAAEQMAMTLFKEGTDPVILGNEYEQIDDAVATAIH
jgi:hypothetical protein